jgi:ferredoxin
MRAEVERVTVVERDPASSRCTGSSACSRRCPAERGRRYGSWLPTLSTGGPDGAVDLLLVDIWLPLVATAGSMRCGLCRPMWERGRSISGDRILEIARAAVAAGRMRLDAGEIRGTMAEMGLPLAGTDTTNIPRRVRAAVDHG